MKKTEPNAETSNKQQIGRIVHGYNNHLAAITGFSELALLHLGNNHEKSQELLELSLQSAKQAVYFGQTLLASIGRLQIETQSLTLYEFKQMLQQLAPQIEIKGDFSKQHFIKTQHQWLRDSLQEILEFLTEAGKPNAINQLVSIESRLDDSINTFKLIFRASSMEIANTDKQDLFEPYHSSKEMFGTAGIGLAKVKGFLQQTQAQIDWKDGIGFELIFVICK